MVRSTRPPAGDRSPVSGRALLRRAALGLAAVLLLTGCPHQDSENPADPATTTVVDPAQIPAPVERGTLGLSDRRETFLEAGVEVDSVRYTVDLAAGDLLDLTVSQHGIDVASRLEAPQGSTLATVDGWLETLGSEQILWVAEAAGTYTVEIEALVRESETSVIELALQPPRPASEFDRRRCEAARRSYEVQSRQDPDRAERLAELIEVWRELGEPAWQRRLTHALAGQYYEERSFDRSREIYRRLLTLEGLEAPRRAIAHHDLAHLAWRGGEPQVAIEQFEQALQVWSEVTDGRRGLARIYNDFGTHLARLRETTRAREHLDRALALWRAQGDDAEQANTLNNRGRVLLSQGRGDEARADLEESLRLWRGLEATGWSAVALDGLAQIESLEGRPGEALALYEEALALRTGPRGRAVTLVGLGEAAIDAGEHERAEAVLQEALVLFRGIPDPRGEAAALRALGRLHETDRPDEAARLHRESLERTVSSGDLDGAAESHLGLARAARAAGRFEQARDHLGDALDGIELLRGDLAGLDDRTRYLAHRQHFYDFGIELLLFLDSREPGAGYAAEAFALAERARARGLLELLDTAGIEPENPLPSDRERDLEQRVAETAERLRRLPAAGAEGPRSALADDLQQWVVALRAERARIRQQSPLYGAITQGIPQDPATLQAMLDPETLLLEYRLAEPRSWLWTVRHDSIRAHALPGASEVETLARETFDFLQVAATALAHRELAEDLRQRLGAMLLGPAEEELDGVRRVVVVADGALQRIPFSALFSAGSEEPLVATHTVSYLPSASLLPWLRRRGEGEPAAAGQVAVIADPRFAPPEPSPTIPPVSTASADPVDVTRSSPESPVPLAGSRAEAEAIRRAVLRARPDGGDDQVLERLGFDAVKESLFDRTLADYRILHIATHGELDTHHPELSRLTFSTFDRQGRRRADSELLAHEVYGLELDNEMVVLSACNTHGGGSGRGDGLAGWTQGFLYSGTERVVVSLWSVNDRATAELMGRFYRFHFEDGLAPADALRRAQEELRALPRWSEPLHWAGFVLIGEFL